MSLRRPVCVSIYIVTRVNLPREVGILDAHLHNFFLFFETWCSTNCSTQLSRFQDRMKEGSHNSLATPRSLQHRIRAFDLHPSVAVAIFSGPKYSCSPRATETRRPWQMSAYSRDTDRSVTYVSPRGASPHPPGPNAVLRMRLYLISGR